MSLPARQERVLERIEHSLHACDPLRSTFAMFTKLTRDEEMPRLERLEAPSSPLRDWLKRQAQPVRGRRGTTSAWAIGAPGTRLRAIMLVPIVLLALAPAALLGLGIHGVSHGGPAFRPQRTAPALMNWAKTCRPAPHGLRTLDCQGGDSALPASGGHCRGNESHAVGGAGWRPERDRRPRSCAAAQLVRGSPVSLAVAAFALHVAFAVAVGRLLALSAPRGGGGGGRRLVPGRRAAALAVTKGPRG